MGSKGGKAPKAPDPRQTASAQMSANIGTAIANQAMQTNQVTPDGSLTYAQTGSYKYTDPLTGRTYDIPTWTATQKLSGGQQAIKDQGDRAKLNMSTLAADQTERLKGVLDKPVDLSNEAVESRLWDLGSKRLQPKLDEMRRRAETSAANSGLGVGGDAYNRVMRNVGEQENDAWNQLMLNGRGQAMDELLTARNQPLNEISSLLSGSPVSQPNFVPTSQPNMPTVDYAGLENNKYQSELAAWQQKRQDANSALGGIFGVLGTAAMYSDRRLKTGVRKVGKTGDGQNVYAYRYKGDRRMHLGLMAQEVEKRKPEAVTKDAAGFMMVDYARALEDA